MCQSAGQIIKAEKNSPRRTFAMSKRVEINRLTFTDKPPTTTIPIILRRVIKYKTPLPVLQTAVTLTGSAGAVRDTMKGVLTTGQREPAQIGSLKKFCRSLVNFFYDQSGRGQSGTFFGFRVFISSKMGPF